jgi:hypothetical protein
MAYIKIDMREIYQINEDQHLTVDISIHLTVSWLQYRQISSADYLPPLQNHFFRIMKIINNNISLSSMDQTAMDLPPSTSTVLLIAG